MSGQVGNWVSTLTSLLTPLTPSQAITTFSTPSPPPPSSAPWILTRLTRVPDASVVASAGGIPPLITFLSLTHPPPSSSPELTSETLEAILTSGSLPSSSSSSPSTPSTLLAAHRLSAALMLRNIGWALLNPLPPTDHGSKLLTPEVGRLVATALVNAGESGQVVYHLLSLLRFGVLSTPPAEQEDLVSPVWGAHPAKVEGVDGPVLDLTLLQILTASARNRRVVSSSPPLVIHAEAARILCALATWPSLSSTLATYGISRPLADLALLTKSDIMEEEAISALAALFADKEESASDAYHYAPLHVVRGVIGVLAKIANRNRDMVLSSALDRSRSIIGECVNILTYIVDTFTTPVRNEYTNSSITGLDLVIDNHAIKVLAALADIDAFAMEGLVRLLDSLDATPQALEYRRREAENDLHGENEVQPEAERPTTSLLRCPMSCPIL